MDTITGFFDKWANSYDADVAVAEWGFEHYKEAHDWICNRLVSNFPSGKIIDLGCGTGVLAQNLSRRRPAIEYIGVDISSRMLKFAKKKSPESIFIQADMRDHQSWPRLLAPDHFHAAVSTYALHHISDAEKISLIRYFFSETQSTNFQFIIVDYAFLNSNEREKKLAAQRKLGNLHVTEEIEAENYADMSVLADSLARYDINISVEKNGVWDWRILCAGNGR